MDNTKLMKTFSYETDPKAEPVLGVEVPVTLGSLFEGAWRKKIHTHKLWDAVKLGSLRTSVGD